MGAAKICPVCGEGFADSNRKYCCQECSREGYRRRQAKYSIKRYHAMKEETSKEAGRARKEKPLQEIARKAREAGMSYGQYVALEYAEIKRG